MIVINKKLFIALLLIGVTLALLGCTKKDSKAINLRLESFAITLSPLKIADTESMKVASLLYSPLVAVNADGAIEPRIAEKWQQIDEKVLEFEIRNNVTFSNGVPLEPKDVVSSICKAMQPTSPWSWALSSIERKPGENESEVKCTGLQIVGEKKIRIVQSNPVTWLLHALDGPPGWIVQRNAKEGEYGLLPGTGPYTIHKITPDVSIELTARNSKSVPNPQVENIIFTYIADGTQAGKMFEAGLIGALSINTPRLVDMLIVKQENETQLNIKGELINLPSGRVRLVVVNEQRLMDKGFNKSDIITFKNVLKSTVNRDAIVGLGKGIIAEPLNTAFPPSSDTYLLDVKSTEHDLKKLPDVKLTVLTESDVYSDLIASIVTRTNVGAVNLSYKGTDKGLLINALVTKDYDLISTVLDANIKSPTFWASFFQPGNPFSIFGKPLPGWESINLNSQEGINKAANLIDNDGNWIGLVKERRIFAMQKNISGIRFTPSGQPRFEGITNLPLRNE